MTEQELARWLRSPLGRYVVDWESTQIDSEVADIFGFNAVQIGLPQQDFLRANRILPADLYARVAQTGSIAYFSEADLQRLARHPGVARALDGGGGGLGRHHDDRRHPA